jgi:subtilisin family serine protease
LKAPLCAAVAIVFLATNRAQTTPSLPWNVKRVRAPQAWENATGQGVKVCVLDTGADERHKGLRIAGGYNTFQPNGAFDDRHGHGTHVAGTIAAQDVGKGVIGIAPDARVYAVKVLNDRGHGSFASIIDGLQWCVENKMDIVNMSLGASQTTQAYQEAVENATAAGLTIIAAAGNSGSDSEGRTSVVFPARYKETIAVAASDWHDAVAEFSSRGPQVDFIAPGVEIRSTKTGGGYTFKSGTSMAAPHVTGLVALYLSAGGRRSPEGIRRALTQSAARFIDVPAEQQGAGMPDALKLTVRTETAGHKR